MSFLSKIGKVAKVASGGALLEGGYNAGKSIASSLSGRPQARAIRDAAKLQVEASDKAIDTVKGMHDQSRADLMPWTQRGNQAGDMLAELLAPGGQLTKTYGDDYHAEPFKFDFASDPGAAFRITTANNAFERSAAGRGKSMGGAAARTLSEFNQNLASDEYGKSYDRYNTDRNYGLNEYGTNRNFFNTDQGNLFSRLFSVSGQGQASAAGQAQQNTQTGAQLSDLFTGIGNAQAGGVVGQANAKAGAAQNILKLLMQGGGVAAGALL